MPLQDILQIIHHSKKSGTLYLSQKGREGSIVFRDGLIIQCFSPSERVDIGKALLDAGRIGAGTLEAAVGAQSGAAQGKRLGSILVEQGAVRFEDIENVVKRQIQTAAAELLAWQEGAFNLVLEDVPRYDSIALALDELTLTQGLDTQHILLEALRTWDEESRGVHEEAPHDPAAAAAEARRPPSPAADVVTPELEDFQKQMEELKGKREAAAMTLTLLKIVARRFERAIFFYAAEDTLVPLGAFGHTPDGHNVAVLAREMTFAPAPGSALSTALQSGRPVEIELSEIDLSLPILDRIGWPATGQACLLPLRTDGRTVALLYADQGQRDVPIGQLESFDPLLEQAARAFESVIESP